MSINLARIFDHPFIIFKLGVRVQKQTTKKKAHMYSL